MATAKRQARKARPAATPRARSSASTRAKATKATKATTAARPATPKAASKKTARPAAKAARAAKPATRAATAKPAKAAKAAKATRATPDATRSRRGSPTVRRRTSAPSAPPPHEAPRSSSRVGRVVEILDAEHPVDALRRFIAGIGEHATVQEGQVILGAAQLMLFPAGRDDRGSAEVQDILDLVLSVWPALPDRSGFHANELLRHAFASVGDDPPRIRRLLEIVPDDPTPELLFGIACTYAVIGDRDAMLDAVADALQAGVSPGQIARDDDFAPYADDPGLRALLAGGVTPDIPVDIDAHVPRVRAALHHVVRTLEDLGVPPALEPPTTLDAVIAMERATNIQLPNDYRALLTLADGMELWEKRFFGSADFLAATGPAAKAREYFATSALQGAHGFDACIPVANWGEPNDWLVYDARGTVRGGDPGYVLLLESDETAEDDLATVLAAIAVLASDTLGVN